MIEKIRPLVGVGVVVINNGQILLGKRKGSHGAGSWSTAGGHLEFGETPEECAARELYEETGLKGLSFRPGPWTNNVFDGSKHYITIFIFADDFQGVPKLMEPDKCEGWHWFSLNKLPSPLFPSVASLFQKFI